MTALRLLYIVLVCSAVGVIETWLGVDFLRWYAAWIGGGLAIGGVWLADAWQQRNIPR
jgi:hypothetical protein